MILPPGTGFLRILLPNFLILGNFISFSNFGRKKTTRSRVPRFSLFQLWLEQSCEMSIFLHRQIFEPKILPPILAIFQPFLAIFCHFQPFFCYSKKMLPQVFKFLQRYISHIPDISQLWMLVVIMMEMVMVMVGECSQPGRLAWLLFYVILKAIQEMSKNTRASQQ